MRTHFIAAPFVLALAFALVTSACSEEPAPAKTVLAKGVSAKTVSSATPTAAPTDAATNSTTVGEYASGSDGTQTVTINGLHIETAPDLPENRSTTTQVVNGDNQMVIVLRGWQVTVQDEKLLVAGHEFGAVPANATIRIAAAGVSVNEELRGPLP